MFDSCKTNKPRRLALRRSAFIVLSRCCNGLFLGSVCGWPSPLGIQPHRDLAAGCPAGDSYRHGSSCHWSLHERREG